ncbi:MAG TPA: nuclear transport factor 2 family protein [Rubrobacter sp.]|nr:nuclear transport factor 2 family protein [Rubrobacter sp.]
MTAADDLVDELIEQYHLALNAFMQGNPEPIKRLWFHRDDVSLTNPQGSTARGWEQVVEAMDSAAATRRDGRFVGSETVAKYVIPGLAYVVEVEHLEAKVHGEEEITPYVLRVTMIFRPEEGVWKVVHRHADQIATPRPAESILDE